jgi:tryptophanyl-tRNA synthetase
VLQAADVLLYQATHVPVGEDQKQHLELARDIAQKFNNDFCTEDAPLFTLPEPIIPPGAARIMSLRDGTAKMSKSDPSDMSRVNLADDPDEVMKKVKKAKTDPSRCRARRGARGPARGAQPGDDLRRARRQLGGRSARAVRRAGFGAFKPALGELLVETLRPITARFTGLLDDREALDAILARGAAKAREIAGPTLEGTYKALGLLRG